MHQFNNCIFILSEYDQTMWQDEQNQIIPYDSNIHGNLAFKTKTSDYEFIKCPVNPQQTSFKYIKLNKKMVKIREVFDLINEFYSPKKSLIFRDVYAVRLLESNTAIFGLPQVLKYML